LKYRFPSAKGGHIKQVLLCKSKKDTISGGKMAAGINYANACEQKLKIQTQGGRRRQWFLVCVCMRV
jgi:hypothetical protein